MIKLKRLQNLHRVGFRIDGFDLKKRTDRGFVR